MPTMSWSLWMWAAFRIICPSYCVHLISHLLLQTGSKLTSLHSLSSNTEEKAQININNMWMYLHTLSQFSLSHCLASLFVFGKKQCSALQIFKLINDLIWLSSELHHNFLYVSVFLCMSLSLASSEPFLKFYGSIMQQIAHILWPDFFIQTEVLSEQEYTYWGKSTVTLHRFD